MMIQGFLIHARECACRMYNFNETTFGEAATPMENLTHPSPIQIWMMAARPRTLPAASAPVLTATAIAFAEGRFAAMPALAALLGALLLQIGANLANDVFDFHRGADTAERLGPTRVTQSGLLSPRQVQAGMWVCFGLAALLGGYLIWLAGWPVMAIGLFSILAAIAYSGGPLPFGYFGLGDLVVFIFFGPVAVAGTYFVQARQVSPAAWAASIPLGLLTTAILVVNNLRDIETDRKTGKRTLAVRIGAGATRWEYTLIVGAAFLTAPLMVTGGLAPVWILLSWLALPFAARLLRIVWNAQGRPLNQALGGTGQLELIFGVLMGIGWVLAALLAQFNISG